MRNENWLQISGSEYVRKRFHVNDIDPMYIQQMQIFRSKLVSRRFYVNDIDWMDIAY